MALSRLALDQWKDSYNSVHLLHFVGKDMTYLVNGVHYDQIADVGLHPICLTL